MKGNTLFRFGLQLYNTVKLNAFYILLSLLVPLILWKVQVGRDIVVSLTEPGERNYLNIPLLIAAFSLLALSNWAIPVLAIDLWRWVLRRRVKSQRLYGGLIALYNGDKMDGKAQFPIRYFASLPWVIFLYVATISCFPDRRLLAAAILVALIASVVALDWLYRSKRVPAAFQGLWDNVTEGEAGDRAKALRYVASITTIFAVFLVIVGALGYGSRHSQGGLMGLVIGANFLAILFNYAYMKFAENVDVRAVGVSYFVSKYIHILSLSFMVVVAILLQHSNGQGYPVEIGFFSPIFVLVIAISLYLFVADIVVTAQLNITWIYNRDPAKYDQGGAGPSKPVWLWYRPVIRLIALGFVFLFFFNSINSHRIRREAASPNQANVARATRPALTDYFDRWLESRQLAAGDTLAVYLVSGQGGGSRAAAWFFMAMNYLDSTESKAGRRFSDQVFSISTVSGSTSGAAMYLADRHLNVPKDAASVVPRLKTIYARNYLSSSFWGALVGDGFEGAKYEVTGWLRGKRAPFPKDRNHYFQQEEVAGYAAATPLHEKGDIDGFFNGDYLAPYLADSAALGTALPLFFVNSAIVERGERGVFAPVDLASFSLATDLYGLFRRYHPQYRIPLVTCVNQSQAFPIINAYNYLDGAGRLLDGGIYENSGTATTLEIYETLRRHVESGGNRHRVKFICVNIVNTDMDVEKGAVRFRPASVLNTLTAAFQSPFGGHEQFSYRNILRRVAAPDTAYSFPLSRRVPLTRMLQPAAIDTMYVALRIGNGT